MRDVEQMSYISKEGKNERIGWLNSLDEKFASTESTWSEEDERMFKSLNKLFNEASCYSCTEGVDKILSWFNSLKDRVQPQPKQEED